jgi:hypothetical protein
MFAPLLLFEGGKIAALISWCPCLSAMQSIAKRFFWQND